ncbi:exodeoxyribonuclease VII large subunit [Roseateles sp. BYS180W]|uniref:Exodeoxyribonuclease 7 large subunit n=1 Tax=Roseateles rivi TaxID=3299028 RepID=A0ABW7FYU3_9BURK
MNELGRMDAARMVWGVGALLLAVSDSLAQRFASVAVEGEISGFVRASSGHCYFTLKDGAGSGAALRCAMFRRAAGLLDFSPQDGQKVQLRGRLAVYEARGELQLVVESMSRAGVGALYEQFLRLRAKLEAEGLFDAERKRALPGFVRRVAIITSPVGAALQDVLTALARRAPHVQALVYPSLVQGEQAPAALVRALAQVNQEQGTRRADLILLVRGGGSLEDLWAFNDERVVRAVAQSGLPVVCGVGHETDISLCDLAADLRAPTPTAAAELAALPTQEWLEHLQSLQQRLRRSVLAHLDRRAQRLDRVSLRLARPGAMVSRQHQRLNNLANALAQQLKRQLAQRQQRLERLVLRRQHAQVMLMQRLQQRLHAQQQRLSALDPQRVLSRGYVWLDDGAGQPIGSVTQLQPEQQAFAVLVDGRAQLRVEGVQPNLALPAKE